VVTFCPGGILNQWHYVIGILSGGVSVSGILSVAFCPYPSCYMMKLNIQIRYGNNQ
jgi:hypothetical protein